MVRKSFLSGTRRYRLTVFTMPSDHDVIVDSTFRITNCRFPTRDCIPFVMSVLSQLVHSRQGISCVCAPLCPRNDLDFAFAFEVLSCWCGHQAFRESSFVSLAHGPRWLFLLSRHREAISAAANQKPFVNKNCAPGNL